MSSSNPHRFLGLCERVLQDGSTECFAVYDEAGDGDQPVAEEKAAGSARSAGSAD